MSEATVLLKEYTPAEGNKPHKFQDGNQQEYTTFKDAIANPAKELLGQQVVIHYTEKQNGNYTNRYLDSIEAAPSGANGDEPPKGTGEWVSAQKPPIEARRIFASTAANCATQLTRALFEHKATTQEVTPEFVRATWDAMNDYIFLSLVRRGEVWDDEQDVRF